MLESSLLSNIGCFIDGTWRKASDKLIDVLNPATGEMLASVPDLGARETVEAIEAAALAMRETIPVDVRRRWLLGIVKLLNDHREELARIITLEQGKPLKESVGEVDYAAGFFRVATEHLYALTDRELPGTIRDARWTVRHAPAGVAGLITPWNFPLAMLAKKLAGAIAAGCASVTKPADLTPLTSVALWHLMESLDMPRGFVNLITGAAKPIGDTLCAHPAVRVISFTGSTGVGKLLMQNVAPHVKRLSLELGGNAPFIVLEDADIEKAADALVASKFRCAGQTCVCANRVLVHLDIEQAFTDAVVSRVAKLKVGDGMDATVDLGPLINRAGWDKVARHLEDALRRGGKRVFGTDPQPPTGQRACFFSPQVVTGITPDMLVSQEETFGPLVAITTFADEQTAIDLANGTPYGLASYVFSRDASRAQRLSRALRFGHVGVNTGSGPIPDAPFGGMKQSGFGREGALEGVLEFCEVQTVCEG